jgi:tetratricopeptide (TPR) repeat protein
MRQGSESSRWDRRRRCRCTAAQGQTSPRSCRSKLRSPRRRCSARTLVARTLPARWQFARPPRVSASQPTRSANRRSCLLGQLAPCARVVELHIQNRHWARAVAVLERLVSLTRGPERACNLIALAGILHSELDAPAEGVAIYDRALDEDPGDRRIFVRIENLLVERQQWRKLTRAYRRMIERLGANPPPDRRPWLLDLWRAPAGVRRRHLRALASATAAYEACVSPAPEDARQRSALAEVYETRGRAGLEPAVMTCDRARLREEARPQGARRRNTRRYCDDEQRRGRAPQPARRPNRL